MGPCRSFLFMGHLASPRISRPRRETKQVGSVVLCAAEEMIAFPKVHWVSSLYPLKASHRILPPHKVPPLEGSIPEN